MPATLPAPTLPAPDAATALAPMVEVWFRILNEHLPDPYDPDPRPRCRACSVSRSTAWPCSLRSLAELARREHADGREEPPTRGRRSLHGAHGTSCAVTPKERQFLQMAAEGRDDDEIAAALDVPERTVRTTIRRITRKLGEPDRTGLLVLALRTGVVV